MPPHSTSGIYCTARDAKQLSIFANQKNGQKTQTLPQRHMHGQPAHEEMLNITSHQKNGKENYNDHHPIAARMAIIKNTTS